MKTILLIRNAFSFDFGGGERLPISIASELNKHGYKSFVVSRSSKLLNLAKEKEILCIRGWWWSRQDWSGLKVLFTPLYFSWQILLTAWYLVLIVRTRADVVHAQSKDDFIAATIAGRLLRKKIVWSDYADLKHIYKNNLIWYKNPIGKLIKKLSILADTVIITSKNDLKLIQESLGENAPSNHQVLYMGVGKDPIEPKPRPKNLHSQLIFGATSRLVADKGIREMIESFKIFNKKHPESKLWLFGEGPDEELFKKMAIDNTDVVFFGYPSDSLNRLASCDIFLHPSYHEGFSISLLEAAKIGLPIIACNVGGNPELIENGVNGILINPKNAKELYEAMNKLGTNEELREKLSSAIRKTFNENYVFEDIVKNKLLPIYEKP